MTMKIYIAGKITGLPFELYYYKFELIEQKLRELGWEPINPCKLGIPPEAPTLEALKICLPALLQCQAIYMLTDWKSSLGAITEHNTAIFSDIPRYYQEYIPVEKMAALLKNHVA